jgi:hypothetical protein
MPENHAQKYDHEDAQDDGPSAGTWSFIVIGSQPVEIAHAKTIRTATQPDHRSTKIS